MTPLNIAAIRYIRWPLQCAIFLAGAGNIMGASNTAYAADSAVNVTDAMRTSAPDYWQTAWQGLSSSFALPLDQLYTKPYDNEWRNALHGLNLSVSYSHPLTQSSPRDNANLGSTTQGATATNNTVQVGLKYIPLSYWFVSLNRTIYLQPNLQNPWNSDWSYSFGYSDWHPWALSLVYSNTFGHASGGVEPAFNAGQLTLSTAFSLPPALDQIFVTGYGDALGCNTALTLTPSSNKLTATLGCKYSLPNGLYVNLSVFYYPDDGSQAAWNPDFSYGFGYFDWRSGAISFGYANSSGNRFKRSETAQGTGGFKNGSLSLSWSKSW